MNGKGLVHSAGQGTGSIPGCDAAPLRTLTLPLKAEYFDAIRDGTKPEEYRLRNDYWRKRLQGRSYDRIVLTKGYPARDDHTRRLELPWRGYIYRTLTHPHFGLDPVEVFAINVARSPTTTASQAQSGYDAPLGGMNKDSPPKVLP